MLRKTIRFSQPSSEESSQTMQASRPFQDNQSSKAGRSKSQEHCHGLLLESREATGLQGRECHTCSSSGVVNHLNLDIIPLFTDDSHHPSENLATHSAPDAHDVKILQRFETTHQHHPPLLLTPLHSTSLFTKRTHTSTSSPLRIRPLFLQT